MRIIKFRAWEKIRLEYGEKYGGKIHFSNESDEKRACGFVIETDSGYSNDDFEWMQFTGLLDKNGKEIYEGDIISYHNDDFREKVEWDFERASWKLPYAPTIPNGFKDIIVIGNIHEHPELLTSK